MTVPQKSKLKIHKVYSGKNFINKPFHHSDGSIYTQVTVHNEGEYCDLNISCKIRDCDRVINLSFGGSTESDFNNSLYKIDTLIRNFNNLRVGIIKGYELKEKLKNESRNTSDNKTND